MTANRKIGWCGILALLAIAVFCAFKFENSFLNALFDVALVFSVFYVEQRESNKKDVKFQTELHELQDRVKQLESLIDNQVKQDGADKPKPVSNVLWEYAVKR